MPNLDRDSAPEPDPDPSENEKQDTDPDPNKIGSDPQSYSNKNQSFSRTCLNKFVVDMSHDFHIILYKLSKIESNFLRDLLIDLNKIKLYLKKKHTTLQIFSKSDFLSSNR